MYIYTYIHIYTHIYTHTRGQARFSRRGARDTGAGRSVHICTYAHIYTHIYTHQRASLGQQSRCPIEQLTDMVYMYTMYTHVYPHIYSPQRASQGQQTQCPTWVSWWIYTHIYTYMYTHTYAYAYIYAHTRTPEGEPVSADAMPDMDDLVDMAKEPVTALHHKTQETMAKDPSLRREYELFLASRHKSASRDAGGGERMREGSRGGVLWGEGGLEGVVTGGVTPEVAGAGQEVLGQSDIGWQGGGVGLPEVLCGVVWCVLFKLWCGVWCVCCGVVCAVYVVVWCVLTMVWCGVFCVCCSVVCAV